MTCTACQLKIDELQRINRNSNRVVVNMLDAAGLETRLGDPVEVIKLLKRERDSLKEALEYLLSVDATEQDKALARRAVNSLSREKVK